MCTLEYMSSATRTVSERKRTAILESAERIFLRNGFADTNLDDVAADAHASKVTIYSHFGSKEGLFVAVIHGVVARRSAVDPAPDPLPTAGLASALTTLANGIVETVRDPVVVGLRRLLIAEQPRHPSLASAWRAATVNATVDELAAHFTALQRRGLLRPFPAASVARQFLWMLIGDALDGGLLDPSSRQPPARSTARSAVEFLLSAYGARAE